MSKQPPRGELTTNLPLNWTYWYKLWLVKLQDRGADLRDKQTSADALALFDQQLARFNAQLPDGWHWAPGTLAAISGPVTAIPPEPEALMNDVIAEIEQQITAAPPRCIAGSSAPPDQPGSHRSAHRRPHRRLGIASAPAHRRRRLTR